MLLHHGGEKIGQRNARPGKGHAPAFKLGIIQNIRQNICQIGRRLTNGAEIGAAAFGRATGLQHLGQADDRRQRRPQLMAHHRNEGRLRPLCPLRCIPRLHNGTHITGKAAYPVKRPLRCQEWRGTGLHPAQRAIAALHPKRHMRNGHPAFKRCCPTELCSWR